MQHRPAKDSLIPFRLRSAANQSPPGDGGSGQDAHLHCMSVPVCVCCVVSCVCVRVCDLPLPRFLALVGYVCMCLCCMYVCTDRIICLPLSYSSSSRRMHPSCFCPRPSCRVHHAVDWPAGQSPRDPLPSCVALACGFLRGRPWADWTGSLGVASASHMGGRFRRGGTSMATGGSSVDGLGLSDGTSFGFWVDVAVARPVFWLRVQDLWIPRECFPH